VGAGATQQLQPSFRGAGEETGRPGREGGKGQGSGGRHGGSAGAGAVGADESSWSRTRGYFAVQVGLFLSFGHTIALVSIQYYF